MKKLKLELEMLEERITPSWIVSPPGLDGDATEDPVGPDPKNFPTKGGTGELADIAQNENSGNPVSARGAWNAHDHSDVLEG